MLLLIAAAVLAATALFHATGYEDVVSIARSSGVKPFLSRALPGMWLFFSWHLLAVAGALGWAATRCSPRARPLIVFTSVLVVADTIFVFLLAGVFAGTVLLIIASALIVGAAGRWPDA